MNRWLRRALSILNKMCLFSEWYVCVNICKAFLWGNDVCSNDSHYAHTYISTQKHTETHSNTQQAISARVCHAVWWPRCSTGAFTLAIVVVVCTLCCTNNSPNWIRVGARWGMGRMWVGGGRQAVCIYFVPFHFFSFNSA